MRFTTVVSKFRAASFEGPGLLGQCRPGLSLTTKTGSERPWNWTAQPSGLLPRVSVISVSTASIWCLAAFWVFSTCLTHSTSEQHFFCSCLCHVSTVLDCQQKDCGFIQLMFRWTAECLYYRIAAVWRIATTLGNNNGSFKLILSQNQCLWTIQLFLKSLIFIFNHFDNPIFIGYSSLELRVPADEVKENIQNASHYLFYYFWFVR